ncbi:hypothetical protein [Pseudomonas chlororaphis]|uniref:hypothetical protein n=2 Tax=Pseudomonas chlororaphis TaxID=587753 RepID=UPI000F58A9EF|nr:hypothetical protein [Pseudomonas chlororaphis]MBP5071840.1 hypothetical protein [Pseudomonas chlororaphis]
MKSHLMPAAAYRSLRNDGISGNSSPLLVDFNSSRAYSTDKQIKMEFLCSTCELRFSKRGEDRMAHLWATEKGFPLLHSLTAVGVAGGGGRAVYPPHLIDEDANDALLYFGASVIWRSNCWEKKGKELSHVRSLGERYERVFREYLLGNTNSMQGVKLLVIVNTNQNIMGCFSLPCHGRKDSVMFHKFHVLGVYFNFIVGSYVPAQLAAPFKRFGTDILITSADMASTPQILDLAVRLQRVEVRGKTKH